MKYMKIYIYAQAGMYRAYTEIQKRRISPKKVPWSDKYGNVYREEQVEIPKGCALVEKHGALYLKTPCGILWDWFFFDKAKELFYFCFVDHQTSTKPYYLRFADEIPFGAF